MQVVEQASARDFAAATAELLAADEANNTLLLSTLERALRADDAAAQAWWGAVAFERSRGAVACLLRDRAGAFISTGTPRAARALGRALRTAAWQQSLVGPAAIRKCSGRIQTREAPGEGATGALNVPNGVSMRPSR